MAGGGRRVSDLIHNERTKLFAAALNTAATSSFTVGALARVAAVFYGSGPTELRLPYLVLGAGGWICLAVVLHLLAQRVLGGLRE